MIIESKRLGITKLNDSQYFIQGLLVLLKFSTFTASTYKYVLSKSLTIIEKLSILRKRLE